MKERLKTDEIIDRGDLESNRQVTAQHGQFVAFLLMAQGAALSGQTGCGKVVPRTKSKPQALKRGRIFNVLAARVELVALPGLDSHATAMREML